MHPTTCARGHVRVHAQRLTRTLTSLARLHATALYPNLWKLRHKLSEMPVKGNAHKGTKETGVAPACKAPNTTAMTGRDAVLLAVLATPSHQRMKWRENK